MTPLGIDNSKDNDSPKDAQGHYDDLDLHYEDVLSRNYEHEWGPTC